MSNRDAVRISLNVHYTPVVSKLIPWVLGNLWPNAARGERLMLGKVIPPGDER
jgi:hypothetical protein